MGYVLCYSGTALHGVLAADHPNNMCAVMQQVLVGRVCVLCHGCVEPGLCCGGGGCVLHALHLVEFWVQPSSGL